MSSTKWQSSFQAFLKYFQKKEFITLEEISTFPNYSVFFFALKQKLHLWHFFLKFLYALMPCPDEGSQGDSCARYDVRPRAWSWPSGFYSLLGRCTISQNITVHADTSPHTRVGLQMLRNSWRRLSAPHLSDLELPHASWLKFVRPNSNFNISWLSWLHFPLVHFFS